MSVARCCCPKKQPPPVFQTLYAGNFMTRGGAAVTSIGANGYATYEGAPSDPTITPQRLAILYGYAPDDEAVLGAPLISWSAWCVFESPGIPPAATITSASIRLNEVTASSFSQAEPLNNSAVPHGRSNGGGGTNWPTPSDIVQANIRGMDVDVPPNGFTAANFALAVARTTASVTTTMQWDEFEGRNWIDQPVGQTGDPVTSPDISSIIQEIVNRPTYLSTHTIGIFFDEQGTTVNPITGPGSQGEYGIAMHWAERFLEQPSVPLYSPKAPTLAVTWT